MIKNYSKILPKILLLLIILCNVIIIPQTENASQFDEIESIFEKLEHGIKTGAIKEFSNQLMLESYISLESGESSYYSANQSFYILKKYFQNYKPISFKLINKSYRQNRPFAVGRLTYSKNGIRGESQVFVALKMENNVWKISQIIIN